MKFQSLFSFKIKKTIVNLSSAEFAQRVVKINIVNISEKKTPKNLIFHANCLHFRRLFA